MGIINLRNNDALVETFHNKLIELIDEYTHETNITHAGVIGVLEIIKHDIIQDVRENI